MVLEDEAKLIDDVTSSASNQLGAQRLNIRLGDWRSLPPELRDFILASLSLKEVFKVGLVCKSFWRARTRRTFHQGRARHHLIECSLSPLVLYAGTDSWYLWGFDWEARIWRTLPPFKKPIPGPDPDLFKDFHIVGHKGLFCINVGKASEAEKLYVCNPLTGEIYELPPLRFPRHPVVIHVHVTLAKRKEFVTSSYLVIAIGSAAIGTESLSRKTEVYDSGKDEWEIVGDAPGADFSLNDYQSGVYCERLKLLLCVGFMVNGHKGILGFDVERRKWRDDWICPFFQFHPITSTAFPIYFAIAQLVECSGKVYLFSEQEVGRNVTHCIDRLDLDNGGGHTWTRVVTRQRQGNRALLVYPEYTCVPVGENKLCIFNTIEKTGVVYDVLNELTVPETLETLPSPPTDSGIMFHSLNPIGYSFEPSFVASAVPDSKKKDVEEEDVKEDVEVSTTMGPSIAVEEGGCPFGTSFVVPTTPNVKEEYVKKEDVEEEDVKKDVDVSLVVGPLVAEGAGYAFGPSFVVSAAPDVKKDVEVSTAVGPSIATKEVEYPFGLSFMAPATPDVKEGDVKKEDVEEDLKVEDVKKDVEVSIIVGPSVVAEKAGYPFGPSFVELAKLDVKKGDVKKEDVEEDVKVEDVKKDVEVSTTVGPSVVAEEVGYPFGSSFAKLAKPDVKKEDVEDVEVSTIVGP